MQLSESDTGGEWANTRARLAEYKLDLPLVLRQLRLCRSTLGSALEFLENGPIAPNTLEQIGECATDTTAEVERLWDILKHTI
jgi:hypothetical protein